MELFDTHAHYDDGRFDGDRDALIRSLPYEGVKLVVNPACELKSSRAAVGFSEKYPHFYAAVGFHPSDIEGADDAAFAEIETLARRPKVVAIGEIGLDYYWDKEHKEAQKAVFRRQMALAQKLGLPVIVHDREAHGDCLEIVDEFPEVRGVFHCFSGSAEFARDLLRRGWYVSFTGSATFKTAHKLREAVRAVPDDRIMIETDSPYLAPEPVRGRRNSSLYLHYICERLAAERGTSPEEFAALCYRNGCRFFGIEGKAGDGLGV